MTSPFTGTSPWTCFFYRDPEELKLEDETAKAPAAHAAPVVDAAETYDANTYDPNTGGDFGGQPEGFSGLVPGVVDGVVMQEQMFAQQWTSQPQY